MEDNIFLIFLCTTTRKTEVARIIQNFLVFVSGVVFLLAWRLWSLFDSVSPQDRRTLTFIQLTWYWKTRPPRDEYSTMFNHSSSSSWYCPPFHILPVSHLNSSMGVVWVFSASYLLSFRPLIFLTHEWPIALRSGHKAWPFPRKLTYRNNIWLLAVFCLAAFHCFHLFLDFLIGTLSDVNPSKRITKFKFLDKDFVLLEEGKFKPWSSHCSFLFPQEEH